MAAPRLTGQEDFRILKPVTVDGHELKRGDLLPAVSPIRSNRYRLEQMCQNRQLEVATVTYGKVSEPLKTRQGLPQDVKPTLTTTPTPVAHQIAPQAQQKAPQIATKPAERAEPVKPQPPVVKKAVAKR